MSLLLFLIYQQTVRSPMQNAPGSTRTYHWPPRTTQKKSSSPSSISRTMSKSTPKSTPSPNHINTPEIRLLEYDIITNREHTYTISGPLLRLWMQLQGF